MAKMYQQCSVCNLKYEREPGYFLGARYISYGLALVTIALLALVVWTSPVVDYESCNLGRGPFLAPGSSDHAAGTSALDLPRPDGYPANIPPLDNTPTLCTL